MTFTRSIISLRSLRTAVALLFPALGLALAPGSSGAELRATASPPPIRAFRPGEKLTYDVSWSNIVKAGTAVMEVKEEQVPDRREALRFIVTSRTTGMMGRLYPLGDTVESVFDPQTMQSLSYNLTASRGHTTKRRRLVFDHARKTAVSTVNDDPPETAAITGPVQDSLSALYYLRTREDFIAGKAITFEVFDSGKTWSVAVQTVAREKVKTPAGEFSAIKIKAYKGLFMSEGEIYIWLTDDSLKVPVLIKSTISIGTIVFTLTGMTQGVP